MVLAWGYVWGLPVTFLVSVVYPNEYRDRITYEIIAGWCYIANRRPNGTAEGKGASSFVYP